MAEVSRIRSSVRRASSWGNRRTSSGGDRSSSSKSKSRRRSNGWSWKNRFRAGTRARERLTPDPTRQSSSSSSESYRSALSRAGRSRGRDAIEQPGERAQTWWKRGLQPDTKRYVRLHRPILVDHGQEAAEYRTEFLNPIIVFPIDFDLPRMAARQLGRDFIAEDRRKRAARDARYRGILECRPIVQCRHARRELRKQTVGKPFDDRVGRISTQAKEPGIRRTRRMRSPALEKRCVPASCSRRCSGAASAAPNRDFHFSRRASRAVGIRLSLTEFAPGGPNEIASPRGFQGVQQSFLRQAADG